MLDKQNIGEGKLGRSWVSSEGNRIYASQSMRIKKKIRLMDLDLFAEAEAGQRKNLNFLVVGPSNSGKKSLLETLSYSLNGPKKNTIETKRLGDIIYDKYQLKSGKKEIIDGLSILKQMKSRVSICGYRLRTNNMAQTKQFIQMIPKNIDKEQQINLALICISTSRLIADPQLSQLQEILKVLSQQSIPYLIVGTKIDIILNDYTNGQCEDRAILIGNWRDYVQSVLRIREKRDVFCMESYRNGAGGWDRSEEIDYYGLCLIQLCLGKMQEKKKPAQHFFNFSCFGFLQ